MFIAAIQWVGVAEQIQFLLSVSYRRACRFWPRLPTCQTVWIEMNVSVHSFRFPWHQFQMQANAMNRFARYTCRAAPHTVQCNMIIHVHTSFQLYHLQHCHWNMWHIHMKNTNSIETDSITVNFSDESVDLIWIWPRFDYAHARAHLSLFLCIDIQISAFLSPLSPSDFNLVRWTPFQFYSHIDDICDSHARVHHNKFH